ncbi:TonB-dependent receptor [Hydrocarboniphaga sp.]|uniref:TonB-dependent receptor n=1 Tax=Hydrocarboniphaga sp. TaxID=2033016 RepID=UPI003D1207E5
MSAMKNLAAFCIGANLAAASHPVLSQEPTIQSETGSSGLAAASSDPSTVSAGISAPLSETSDATGLATVPVVPPSEQGTVDDASTVTGRTIVNRAVEEVIVTSERREANLQEVPLSVSAFSGDALEARGVADTKSLGKVTPGLQFTSQLGYLFPYIRGIGSDAFVPAVDPAVVTYLDGVYLLSGQGMALAFGGIQRVEVLKGPQGTLFGRNAVGGAISAYSKQPGNRWEGSVSQEVSDFRGFRSKAFAAGPVTDWLGVAADVNVGASDNAYTNLYYKVPRNRDYSGRFEVTLQPLDGLDINLNYLGSYFVGAGSTIQKNTHPSPLAQALLITPQEDNYTSEQDFPADGGGHQKLIYGSANYRAEPFDTKLTLSDQHVKADRQSFDYDGSPQPLVSAQANQVDMAKSAELAFTSNGTSWGHESFKWVAGAFYFDETGGYQPVTLSVASNLLGALSTGALVPGLTIPPSLQQFIAQLDSTGALSSGTGGVPVPLYGLLDTTSVSGFGQGTWFITDIFSLTLGARYQSEKRKVYGSRSTVLLPTGRDQTLLQFNEQTKTNKNFSPKATLSAQTDGVLYYAGWSKAFKGGTFNTVNLDTQPSYVVPQAVTSYEVGVKSEFPSLGLRLNSALFYTDIQSPQVLYVSILTGGAIVLENAQKARTKGVEFEGTWTPLMNIDPGLVLTGNFTYCDARFTKFTNGHGYNPNTLYLSAGNLDFSGNRIPRTAKVTSSIGFVQTIGAGDNGELELAMDATYNSGFTGTRRTRRS